MQDNLDHKHPDQGALGRFWKLNVQGVLITSAEPTIIVKDALVEAGFDPNTGWIVVLKKAGQPKEPVGLEDTIDLTDPGIEKLRLTPAEINNGEAPLPRRRDFELLEKDASHLDRLGLKWEALLDGGRRWLLLRGYVLPAGYNHELVDIAIDIPPTYPAAEIDMFFCNPQLSLTSGNRIAQTDGATPVAGINYQQWSRHLRGITKWNPETDSVITHLALIEESLLREVGQ